MDDINISLETDLQIILNSHIQMCGDAVLQSIEIEDHYAKYKLLGFDKPQIFICDFRKKSLREIKRLEDAKNNSENIVYDGFLDQFTKPALLCIKQQNDKNIIVELRDAQKENPGYLLFMYNGVKVPTTKKYNFVVRKTVALEKKKKALFFIVDIP